MLSRTPLKDATKDWPEDFGHENGNYQCRCCDCGSIFIGYKRRVLCKVCAGPERTEPWTKEEIDRFNAALAEVFGWKK